MVPGLVSPIMEPAGGRGATGLTNSHRAAHACNLCPGRKTVPPICLASMKMRETDEDASGRAHAS
jgi:hypothetical protein